MREVVDILEKVPSEAVIFLGIAGLCLLVAVLILLTGGRTHRHRQQVAELQQQAAELQRLLEWRQAQLQWLIARLREIEQQVRAQAASQARSPGRLRLDEQGTLIEEN